MSEEILPKQELLIKLMGMTTSSNDGEALVAIRKANALLQDNKWDWQKLIHGKIKIIEDPFKNGPSLRREPPPPNGFAQPAAPSNPIPRNPRFTTPTPPPYVAPKRPVSQLPPLSILAQDHARAGRLVEAIKAYRDFHASSPNPPSLSEAKDKVDDFIATWGPRQPSPAKPSPAAQPARPSPAKPAPSQPAQPAKPVQPSFLRKQHQSNLSDL